MKKYLSLLVALAVTLFSFSSFAFTAPEKPANGWYVLDQAGKLSESEKTQLNQKIENLNKTTKNEYAVVILSTLDGSNIEDAAQDTFRSWGVGKKDLNNGVLLMISVGERKTRIQTGKGAEGDLPDLLCKDILDKTLKPHLKRGHWYEGIDASLDAMSAKMENHGASTPSTNSTPVTTPTSSPSGGCSMTANGDVGSGLFMLVLLVGGITFMVFRNLSARSRQAKVLAEMEAANLQEEIRARAERATRAREASEALSRLNRSLEVTKPVPLRVVPQVPMPVPAIVSKPLPVPQVRKDPAPVHTAPRPSSLGLGLAATGSVAAASVAALALAEENRKREAEATAARHRREEEAARKRKREAEEEEDRRARRRREDDDRSSSSSSGSSWDSGSSWGGGGFGGGDSGGGGASGDF